MLSLLRALFSRPTAVIPPPNPTPKDVKVGLGLIKKGVHLNLTEHVRQSRMGLAVEVEVKKDMN